MFDVKRGSVARCLLIWLLATGAAAALVAWAAPDLAAAHDALAGARGPAQPFDAWLTRLCAAVAALCAAWGWLVTSVVVAEAMTGRPRRTGTPGVPRWARRLVLAACGVAVLGAGAPAVAAPDPTHDDDPRRSRTTVLDGLPLPDRAEGRSVSEAVARAIADSPVVRPGHALPPFQADQADQADQGDQADQAEGPVERAPARPAPVTTRDQHLVRPGDSLWSIAFASLFAKSGAAPEAEVAAYWPEIYLLNRDRLGGDPDLLLPGQLLRLPDLPTPTTREDDR